MLTLNNFHRHLFFLWSFMVSYFAIYALSSADCPSTGTSWIRDNINCSKYYACIEGIQISMPPCPYKTVYSLLKEACVWQDSIANDCKNEININKHEHSSMRRRKRIADSKSLQEKQSILLQLFQYNSTSNESMSHRTRRKYFEENADLFSTTNTESNEILRWNFTNSDNNEFNDGVNSNSVKKATEENNYYSYYYDSTENEEEEFDEDDYSWDYNNEENNYDWSEEGDGDLGSCGYSVSPFIIGGGQAAEGTWPWQVSLQVLTDPPSHRCGGVLINPSWILTAAHCVYGTFNSPEILQVVLADNDLINDSGFEVYRYVDEIVRHPGYIPAGGYPNDIALVKLAAPVNPFENFVNTVCLPEQDDVFNENDECYMTGWGSTLGTGYRWVLNELATNIRTSTYCKNIWSKNYVEYSHLCVGNGENGACQGDSGGPLLCSRNGRMFVVGIASWAVIGCRRDGYPNMFTKVSTYSDWIYSTMEDR